MGVQENFWDLLNWFMFLNNQTQNIIRHWQLFLNTGSHSKHDSSQMPYTSIQVLLFGYSNYQNPALWEMTPRTCNHVSKPMQQWSSSSQLSAWSQALLPWNTSYLQPSYTYPHIIYIYISYSYLQAIISLWISNDLRGCLRTQSGNHGGGGG